MKSHPSGTIAGKSRSTVNYKQQLPRTERGAESNGLTGTRPRGTTKCATHGKHTDKASTKRDLHAAQITRGKYEPRITENKPGTTEMPKTEGAQLACEGTGPPGPAACLANFYRCPHRPSRA